MPSLLAADLLDRGVGETRGPAAAAKSRRHQPDGPAAAFGGIQLLGIATRHVLCAPEQVLDALMLTAGP